MIPASFYLWLVAITALLLFQLRSAVAHRQAALTILVLTFGIFFVFGGMTLAAAMEDFRPYFGTDEASLTLAAVYGFLAIAATWLGYRVPQKVKAKPSRFLTPPPAAVILLISCLGLAATAWLFVVRGGISEAWGRAHVVRFDDVNETGQGSLSVIADLTLIYPLYVFRAYPTVSRGQLRVATVIGVIYVVAAAVSSVATAHMVNAVGFALVWLQRRRPSVSRIVLTLFAAVFTVNVLRFLRYLGTTTPDGGDWWTALLNFHAPEEQLNLRHSINTLLMFAKTIEVTQWAGFQWGKPYLAVLASLVPAILFPGGYDAKYELVLNNMADTFVPRFYGLRNVAVWPTGFYGEGYMSCGVVGILVASLIVGVLVRRAELWSRRSQPVLGLPAWLHACYLLAALVDAVRSGASCLVQAYGLRIAFLLAFVVPLSFLRAAISAHSIGMSPTPVRGTHSGYPRGARP
jgi:hypothetical protein